MEESRQRLLQLALRVGGAVLLCAAFAIVMPTSWMIVVHDRLGLGPFPNTPVVQYLTRSISGLYAVHGGLLIVLGTDVVRYRLIIVYLGITNVILGVIFLVIDLVAGLPWYWVVGEGPVVAFIGIVFWVLAREGKQSSD